MNLERLAARIGAVPLFSALGTAIPDPRVTQILSWDAWAGPEDPCVMAIGYHQQCLHDAIVRPSGELRWDQALQAIIGVGKKILPYVDGEDAWYGPNAAVWNAAWTFSLEEAYLDSEVAVPPALQAQLYWYERGHWPCALVDENKPADVHAYLLF